MSQTDGRDETSSQENVLWKSFYEELTDMPFQYRCIVLGIAMGIEEGEIRKTLHLTLEQYEELGNLHGLQRWKFLKAVIDA